MMYRSNFTRILACEVNGIPQVVARTKRLLNDVVCISTLALVAIVACVPTLAQNTTADIVGTVTDSSGAVISGATVELTNVETQEKRTIISGESGEYTFTLLKPSRYSLTVTASGFKVFKISS